MSFVACGKQVSKTQVEKETIVKNASMNFTCRMSKMKESTGSVKIVIRTRIQDELQEVEEMNQNLKAEVEDVFQREGYERKKVCDELAKLEDDDELHEVCWKLCQVALGAGTFARPKTSCQNRRDVWLQRKTEVKRWVNDWSQDEMDRFNGRSRHRPTEPS